MERRGHKPRNAKEDRKPPGAGRGRRDPTLELQRPRGPADTLTSGLWPLGLEEETFLLF